MGIPSGGFLLLYAPPERQASVTKALEARGLQRMAFRFDTVGAQVLMASSTTSPVRLVGLRAAPADAA